MQRPEDVSRLTKAAQAPTAGDAFQRAFWATKKAMTLAVEQALSRHGVRAGQQFVLRCLWEEDGLTPGAIAARLNLATPTVTRTATRLEAAGLVVRRPHDRDARLVRLCLTERGRELEAVVGAELRELGERALGALDEGERETLVRLLDEVRANLAGA